MLKNRVSVPRSTRQIVLQEFNQRCAVCGKEKPKLHFIDGDHKNSDALNLLPLCPNAVHLFDPHNPTADIETPKLHLLREFKDPSVIKPQFHTIYRRLQFLDRPEELRSIEQISEKVDELVNFLVSFEMGVFYGGRIHELLKVPTLILPSLEPTRGLRPGATETLRELDRQHEEQFRQQLRDAQHEVFSLCVEMLRFQRW